MIDFSCLLFVIPVIVLFANEIKKLKVKLNSEVRQLLDELENIKKRNNYNFTKLESLTEDNFPKLKKKITSHAKIIKKNTDEFNFFKADSISKIICIEDILEDLTERVANKNLSKNLSPDKYLPKQRIKPKKKTLVSKILESKTSKKI